MVLFVDGRRRGKMRRMRMGRTSSLISSSRTPNQTRISTAPSRYVVSSSYILLIVLTHTQILRISPKDDRALIYVTDYTPRPDLSFIAATADWTRGIPHDRILKVALLQAQAKAAEAFRAGDFVSIRKMRLKAVLGGALSGLLGGEERLLFKLDPVNTGNEDCLALLE